MKTRITVVFTMTLIFCVFAFAQVVKNPLVEKRCSTCHTTDRIYSAKKTAAEWDSTVARMVRNGLRVTPDEEKEIKAFLYTLK